MQFKITVIDPMADDINASKHEYKFLRNLNTEKMFRDNTGAELQAQLSTLYEIQANFENADSLDDEDKKQAAIKARMDLNFSETRHEVLKYMFAESKDGALVQNDETRNHFEEIEDIDETQALVTFFRNV